MAVTHIKFYMRVNEAAVLDHQTGLIPILSYKYSGMPIPNCAGRSGFSLIELLVVISIIAVLASILLPVINLVRESAQMTVCSNRMKQLGLAEFGYANDQEGFLPVTKTDGTTQAWLTASGQYGTWPFLLSNGEYLDRYISGGNWYKVSPTKSFVCPSNRMKVSTYNALQYLPNIYLNGTWSPGVPPTHLAQITRPTLLLSEVAYGSVNFGWGWVAPTDNRRNWAGNEHYGWAAAHKKYTRANILVNDGHVESRAYRGRFDVDGVTIDSATSAAANSATNKWDFSFGSGTSDFAYRRSHLGLGESY